MFNKSWPALLTVVTGVIAQTTPEVPQGTPWFGTSYASQNVCPGLTNNANATGVEPVVRNTTYGGTITESNGFGTWKVEVSTNYSANSIESAISTANENTTDAVANIWLDPFEGVNLNDGENEFSACAYLYKTLPANTNLRGQDDDTTCEQMLSKKCVEALTERAATIADWMVTNPTLGPYSNLTPPILAPICLRIQEDIGAVEDNMPAECRPYFWAGDQSDSSANSDREYPTIDEWVLTSNVTKPTNCSFFENRPFGHQITQQAWNSPPGEMLPYNGTSPADAYDALVSQVWPILTVVMPPANVSRSVSRKGMITGAYAKMTCIRANNIKQGSRVPPPLSKAKPVHFPHSRSWYGVRVGIPVAIIGAVLIATLAWFCIRRTKRKNAPFQAIQEQAKTNSDEDIKEPVSAQMDGAEVYQLAGKEKPVQLQATHKVEMDAGPAPRRPKGDDGKPQEMMGDVPPMSGQGGREARRSSF